MANEIKNDGKYQCGSCEQFFDEPDGGACPNCGSGNFVEGCIDDPDELETLAIGINSDEDSTQIITQGGWHVCNIEFSPTKEIAEEIVRRFNAFPGLESMYEASGGIEVILNRKIKSLEYRVLQDDKLAMAEKRLAAFPGMLEALKEAKTILYNVMNGKERRSEIELQAIFDTAIKSATI